MLLQSLLCVTWRVEDAPRLPWLGGQSSLLLSNLSPAQQRRNLSAQLGPAGASCVSSALLGGPGPLCSSARAQCHSPGTSLLLLRLGTFPIPFGCHPPSLCFASDTVWVLAAFPAASPSSPLLLQGSRLQCAPPQQAALAATARVVQIHQERKQSCRRGIHSACDGWLEVEEALLHVCFIQLYT